MMRRAFRALDLCAKSCHLRLSFERKSRCAHNIGLVLKIVMFRVGYVLREKRQRYWNMILWSVVKVMSVHVIGQFVEHEEWGNSTECGLSSNMFSESKIFWEFSHGA